MTTESRDTMFADDDKLIFAPHLREEQPDRAGDELESKQPGAMMRVTRMAALFRGRTINS